jgi:hypothetical protein
MEPNTFEVVTTPNKAQRDSMFEDLRKNGLPNERMAVKFSGVYETRDENGQITDIQSSWSVAYPSKEVWKQNHGSTRNPRKFPGRKQAA